MHESLKLSENFWVQIEQLNQGKPIKSIKFLFIRRINCKDIDLYGLITYLLVEQGYAQFASFF